MSQIKSLKGREIIDSRGYPTLEVEVELQNGEKNFASIPSGASTGQFEAHELRDGNPDYFFGKGVIQACKNVSTLSRFLEGFDVCDLKKIDETLLKLDGTYQKEKWGANTLLGISLACAKVAAQHSKQPVYQYFLKDKSFYLPVPLMNIINGGKHGDNELDIQEFMIVPYGFKNFKEALRAGCEIFQKLKSLLKEKNLSTAVGDEGGFSPRLKNTSEALNLVMMAIQKTDYESQVGLALDCASNEFYKDEFYHVDGKKLSSSDLISMYEKWISEYPILSIEDGLSEEDWSGWIEMTKKLGSQVQLVGDDLFVTHVERLKKGIENKSANSLLVKCNQVGTFTEAYRAVEEAHKAGYTCIISHRSGETEDTLIADLAVAWSCEQIKTGSLSRGERTAKYNRLIRIEEELKGKGIFRGASAFKLKNR